MKLNKNNNYRDYLKKINDVYQKPAAKASLFLALTIFSLNMLIFIVIRPAIKIIIDLNKEIQQKQAINTELEKKLKNLKQAQAIYISLQNDLIYLDRSLPTRADFNRFASEINYLSYANSLILSSASFGNFDLITKNNNPNEISFGLKLTGGLVNTKDFLKNLQNLDRIVNIESISLANKTALEKAEVEFNIIGKIFWLGQIK